MKNISTLIVGAGQAGLAMSRELTLRSEPHVLIERGEVANSWAHERWDSLRLLTPNWQSRLPGHGYTGPDPEGYMTASASPVVERQPPPMAPVRTKPRCSACRRPGAGYRVQTDQGADGGALVPATGAAARAHRPAFARDLPAGIAQITPLDYKRLAAGPGAGGRRLPPAARSPASLQRRPRRDPAVGAHVQAAAPPPRHRHIGLLDIIGRWNDRFLTQSKTSTASARSSLQSTGLAGDNPLGLNASRRSASRSSAAGWDPMTASRCSPGRSPTIAPLPI
ncbi:MAG: hypothetical protein R3D80_12515 [Paracoccaceae bacterium]